MRHIPKKLAKYSNNQICLKTPDLAIISIQKHSNLSQSVNCLKKICSCFANEFFQRLSAAARKFDIDFVENYQNDMLELSQKKITFQQFKQIPSEIF